jgi:hypothetical protein
MPDYSRGAVRVNFRLFLARTILAFIGTQA